MKRRIFVVSDFPSLEKPTYYSWIKTRVESLKDLYDINVVKINIGVHQKNHITKISYEGYDLLIIHVKKINIPKISFFYSEFIVKRIMSKLIEDHKPDLIHVHFTSYFSWIVKDIAKSLNIPYCITEHATFFETAINNFYIGSKMRKALVGANQVFAVSSPLKKIISKYIIRDIRVKFNIVDTEKFHIIEKEKNRDYVYMLTVGSFEENDKKGYELLIQALAKYKEDNSSFRCEVVGEGANKMKLLSLIEQYQLQNHVFLIGTVSNDRLVEFYNNIDFFVSSSRKETFGVAIVEAMSCGVPILATRSGGPEDFITDDVGILVDNNSIEALYTGIKELTQTYTNYDRGMIRQYTINNFSKKIYAERTRKIYDEILSEVH